MMKKQKYERPSVEIIEFDILERITVTVPELSGIDPAGYGTMDIFDYNNIQ